MCSGGASVSKPAVVPEAPHTPDETTSTVASDVDKRRRAAAAGEGTGTIMTSSRGVTESGQTAGKTLLGQ